MYKFLFCIFKGCEVRWSWLIYILVRLLLLSLCGVSLNGPYALNFILSHTITVVLTFFWVVFTWYVFSHPSINFSMWTCLGISYKQHIDFWIQSDNLCLLICKFNPFLYVKIVDIFELASTTLICAFCLPYSSLLSVCILYICIQKKISIFKSPF